MHKEVVVVAMSGDVDFAVSYPEKEYKEALKVQITMIRKATVLV